jgi:hypothetical protein
VSTAGMLLGLPCAMPFLLTAVACDTMTAGKNPLDFVGLSALRWDGDKAMEETFNTTEKGWETNRGTVPEGSTWRKVPIPSGIWTREGPQFEPVCQESEACIDATRKGLQGVAFQPQGVCRCSGYSNGGPLLPNVEMVDTVRIPAHLKPGKYVVQWRWYVRGWL